LKAKGFLRNDKIKGKGIKLRPVVFLSYAAVKFNTLHYQLLVLRNISYLIKFGFKKLSGIKKGLKKPFFVERLKPLI